jgi:prevent-host-death family protein
MSTTTSPVQTVNIYEAKTQLSKLVDLAAAGQEIIIARAGKPIARLTSLKKEKRPIVFGLLEGEGWIADDFNAPLPDDLQAAFEGH